MMIHEALVSLSTPPQVLLAEQAIALVDIGGGNGCLQVFPAGSPGLCTRIGNGQGVAKSVPFSQVDTALPGSGHQPTATA